MVSNPEQMPRLGHIAMQTALGRGGVSVLVLPRDVAHRAAATPVRRSTLVNESASVVPPSDQVHRLAEVINAADKVTLFVGAGARDAHDEVMRLAATILSPVGHALGGKEWIQYDNPYDVGMSGLLGYGTAFDATHEADLLVLMGTDFPCDTFLPQHRIAQVDRDPTKIGRRAPIDIAVNGDIAASMPARGGHCSSAFRARASQWGRTAVKSGPHPFL